MSKIKDIAIITPCFNENSTVIEFLKSLEEALINSPYNFHVVVVDDSSTDDTLDLLKAFKFSAENLQLTVLTLQFNSGHQGAIFQGLMFAQSLEVDRFIVLDSDGEDNPQAINELLQFEEEDIVHVVRGKRNESLLFRFSYSIYRLLFKFITGKKMDFGNYSMINRKVLESAIHNSFVHFPAFLLKQKAQRARIIADRQKRIDGNSKMNYSGLVQHAFKSLVEHAEDLLMVFLKMFVVIMILFLAASGNVIYQKFFAHTAIVGWTSVVAIGLLNLAVIAFGFFVLGVLLLNITHQRNRATNKAVFQVAATTADSKVLS